MKIYIFGESNLSIEMDTDKKKLRNLSGDEQELLERRDKQKKQHIIRLKDVDVAMIRRACERSGYATA